MCIIKFIFLLLICFVLIRLLDQPKNLEAQKETTLILSTTEGLNASRVVFTAESKQESSYQEIQL